MPLSFVRMSHFVAELFFSPKISLTFTSVITHIHLVKKIHNRTRNSYTCWLFNICFTKLLSFSNCRGIIELQKYTSRVFWDKKVKGQNGIYRQNLGAFVHLIPIKH